MVLDRGQVITKIFERGRKFTEVVKKGRELRSQRIGSSNQVGYVVVHVRLCGKSEQKSLTLDGKRAENRVVGDE